MQWEKQPWIVLAACRDVESSVFFAAVGMGDQYGSARRICATCAVVDACLEYAMKNEIYEGMWGGMSPNQRRRLRREREQGAS